MYLQRLFLQPNITESNNHKVKKEKKAQKEQSEEKVEKAADGSEAVKQNLPVIQKATTVIENRIPTLASHIDEQNLLKHKEVSPQVEAELAANEINPSLNKKKTGYSNYYSGRTRRR